MLRPLLIAVQFMTRLPLPKNILQETDYQPEQLGKSVVMYPVVGLIIGAMLVLILMGLNAFAPQLQAIVVAALILFSWALLTGALHLDGLSDSADAWIGGYGNKDKTLAIMKDPYCGPAGVSIIVITLLVKFAALTTVIGQSWVSLLIAPVMARSAVIVLFMSTSYVRKDGIGASHAEHLPQFLAWLMLGLVVLGCGYFLQVKVLWLLLAVGLVFLLLRYLMMNRIGGTTGDTAGAVVEVIEVVVLLVFALSPLPMGEG